MYSALFTLHRQLYAQDAACRLQDGERDGKSLQRLSKEEYLKMMLPDDPTGDGTQKVSLETKHSCPEEGVRGF